MLEYAHLKTNKGSIVQHRRFANRFPWCFTADFIRTDRTSGIAPIIGVRGDECIPFVCAVISGSHLEPNPDRAHKLVQKQHLQRAGVISTQWIIDNLPLWLNHFTAPNYTVYQLTGQHCTQVDGASAGLSMLLATLSHILDSPLAADWMYSATLLEDGRLGPVNSIEEKIQGILRYCPNVRHFVLGDYGKETESLRSKVQSFGINVHFCPTIHEAFATIPIGSHETIHECIEQTLGKWFDDDHQTLLDFIDHAFLSALQGFSQIYGWGSLGAMFNRLKNGSEIMKSLEANYHCKIDMIIMISDRYVNGRNRIEGRQITAAPIVFTRQHLIWLQNTEPSIRLMVLPHLMQQIHERPESIECKKEIIELTQALLPNKNLEWIPPLHLKLMGSWARYLRAETSRHEEAYQLQRLCFSQWCNSGFYDQASYPICAMMELSIQLPHHEAEVLRLWHTFANKPNARVSQIKRFIPEFWRKKLFKD